MTLPQRLDPLDFFDVPPDEELPSYEPPSAPEYQRVDSDAPLHTYHLRQDHRKLQTFVPLEPATSAVHRVAARGGLFSKKPDLQLLRASTEQAPEKHVASIYFDNDGPLPWCPRAHFTHTGAAVPITHTMEAKNFQDWTLQIRGVTYAWVVEGKPVGVALCEMTSHAVAARFTYSRCGTRAARGMDVGELVVYRDDLSLSEEGVEKILCGLMVAIVNLKKMGRHYWNDAPVGGRAVAGRPLRV
ncbi:hypothetical protein BDV95DRAFT_500140 [Massariosphaeria phaeospora]|uniref:Uncharacterized protein n=1 Tax=Massariosphaeria phaeospora TaxID=100035 RepID=A0A7C8I1V0_9PLEO|nr:hypothetical protein BDV95DRAFT_500140 [Massariosphaeria phaeospora]